MLVQAPHAGHATEGTPRAGELAVDEEGSGFMAACRDSRDFLTDWLQGGDDS